MDDPNLLVGAEQFSDAGVYRISDDLALVQTTDFFPPIVDDPFIYGQIAAANALGDVYAMGGTPRTALNIVGFPDDELDTDVLHEILRGGAERVLAAGAVLVGGHSVRDKEVKYGLSVTGTVDPARMLTNAGANPGDALVLTKPLGTGLITTANRAGRCPSDVLDAACASMIALNGAASTAAVDLHASGATDITGFGMAGHALELARASAVTIRLDLDALPIIDGVLDLSAPENHSRAMGSNRDFAEASIDFAGGAESPIVPLLFDPQTSGGLLISIAPARARDLVDRCRAEGASSAVVVGSVTHEGERPIVVGG